jgi:spore maturation protein CgeB
MKKIVFLLEDYNEFYTKETNKLLHSSEKNSYDYILSELLAKKFYQSNSMANAFKRLGFDTSIIIPESYPIQLLWAKENFKKGFFRWKLRKLIRSYIARMTKNYRIAFNNDCFFILNEQLKRIKPDIVYVYSDVRLFDHQLLEIKKLGCRLVLQWTTPLNFDTYKGKLIFPYNSFDLITTASMPLRDYFLKIGVQSIYLQQAFDIEVLDKVDKTNIECLGDVVFIGSFTLGHSYRFEILEFLLQNGVDLTIYGFGSKDLLDGSLVSSRIKPPKFGIEMYEVLMKYKIALHIPTIGKENDEIDWNNFASAKRIFEVTGVGTTLITTNQQNLTLLFKVDEDIITFDSKEELLCKISKLLGDDEWRNIVGLNGQRTTLKHHTFENRTKEILDNFKKLVIL